MLCRRRSEVFASLTLLALLAVGCGPKLKSSLPHGASLPATIAVLPPDYSVDIPRERIDLVHTAVVRALRNQNFLVVEDRVIESVCSLPSCPEKTRLGHDYLVDAFATVSLTSFSKNNFVAGYYNQLQGELLITDKSGTELVRVAHTEDESGGLLLQSGQVFQAIISTVKNNGDRVFENLAQRFANTVIEQLPAHQTSNPAGTTEGLELALTSASVGWDSPASYSVCALGTPHSFAYLLTGTIRSQLREISPGKYCGKFSPLLTSPTRGIEAVELRTVFGNSLRKEIDLPSDPPCDLKSRLVRSTETKVDVLCSRIGSDPSNEANGCSATMTRCDADRIVLYEAPSLSGPYKKVSELKSSSLPAPQGQAVITALAVGVGGVPSQPEPLPSGQ